MGKTVLEVLNVEELSEYLRVHPSTIYRLLKKNELPAFKIGSDWRFNRASIDRWVLDGERALMPKEEANGRV